MTTRLAKRAGLRKALSAAATVAAVAGCAASAVAGPPALPVFASDGGAPSSGDAGHRLMAASGMAPGDSVRRALTIGNPREHGARLALGVAADDSPGPFGGLLSERLRLVIRSGDASVVYRGPLPAGELALGRLGAGESERYRLTVIFPDGGRASSNDTGDNAYQGSSSSLDFSWRLR